MRCFKNVACFLIVIFSYSSNAQNLGKGYVVTLESDTIHGYIVDRIDARLSKGIEFSTDAGSAKTSYLPSNLKAFGFDNGRYFRQVSYTDSAGIHYFFGKRIVKGKVDMYTKRMLTNDQPDIYLVNNSSNVEALLFPPTKEFIQDSNGKKYVPDEFKHLGLLTYVKDGTSFRKGKKRLRYNERDIQRDIAGYNSSYASAFPTSIYKETYKFTYDITVGFAINGYEDDTNFRVAFYRTKSFPEKSRTISFLRGISYRYWSNGSGKYREQTVNIVPIGFNVHTAKGFVRPYFYGAGGVLFHIQTENSNTAETNGTDFYIYPAINIGAGIKVKVGNKFILAEVTPTFFNEQTIFGNVGFSF